MTSHYVHTMGKTGSVSIREALWRINTKAIHTHHLEEKPKADGMQFVISPIREPIARNISAYFENYPQGGRTRYPLTMYDFIYTSQHFVPLIWFDYEFLPVWGIDVYSKPFDTEVGWQIYEQDNVRALVIRLESFDRWQAAYEALTDQNAPVVHHDHRTTGSAYERFKRKEVVPEFYKRFIGTSKFAQHFYGDVYGHYKIEKGWGL